MNIEIREINISDGEEIAAACAIERANLSTAWSEAAILECEHSDTIKYLIAKDGGIVGICSFALVVGEGQLINIAVTKSYRHKGIGSMLLEAAIKMAEDAKAEQFTLEVEAYNAKAIEFYKKHQFNIYLVRKDFYSIGTDAICMMKSLTK